MNHEEENQSLNYQKLLKILKKQSGNQMAWKLLAAMKYLAKIKILIK